MKINSVIINIDRPEDMPKKVQINLFLGIFMPEKYTFSGLNKYFSRVNLKNVVTDDSP